MTEIVNVSKNWAIGKKGCLLVHLKEDMAFFRNTTRHKVCLMGSVTLESFPRMAPLRDRVNIVLVDDEKKIRPESVQAAEEDRAAGRSTELIYVFSLEEALEKLAAYDKDDVFVVGGAGVYRLMLPYADKCLVTHNDAEIPDADAYFPDLDATGEWTLAEQGEEKEENGVRFRFCTYVRNGAAKE